MDEVLRLLTGAGLLPEVMPENATFRKFREVLKELEGSSPDECSDAVGVARRLNIRDPLASVIFIKHHLTGEHEVEVDRISEGEGGARFAVLVYPEGEVPVQDDSLPRDVREGVRLRYLPNEGQYR